MPILSRDRRERLLQTGAVILTGPKAKWMPRTVGPMEVPVNSQTPPFDRGSDTKCADIEPWPK